MDMAGNELNDIVQGTEENENLKGSGAVETINGGQGNDTISGEEGNDILNGGDGSDDFELSEGNDVIQDFDKAEGDKIILPDDIDIKSINIKEKSKQVVISWKNQAGEEFKTKVKGEIQEVIASTVVPKLEKRINNFVKNSTINEKDTVVLTGLITSKNPEIELPAADLKPESIKIYNENKIIEELTISTYTAKRNEITYSIDNNKITFNNLPKTGVKQFKIAAEFEWDNPASNYLTWMRDVIQFGDKDENGTADPINAENAFRLYMGDKITDIKNLSIDGSTSTYQMFDAAARFNGDLSDLNLDNVTDMYSMFRHAARFNNGGSEGIKNWDTSNVTRMRMTFWNALSFNQPIGEWSVEAVEDDNFNGGMSRMFKNTPKFDQRLSDWSPNIYSGYQTDFNTTLGGSKQSQPGRYSNTQLPNFKGDSPYAAYETVLRTRNIKRWIEGNKEIVLPFNKAEISKDIVKVQDNNGNDVDFTLIDSNLSLPKSGADQYTIKIEGLAWDNSENGDNDKKLNKLKWLNDVIQFADIDDKEGGDIASGKAAFAGYGGQTISDLSNLDTSELTSMRRMFSDALRFDQDLGSNFLTEKVRDTFAMFNNAGFFNNGGSASIGKWDTSDVTYMRSMFETAALFNQPLKEWNTSAVRDEGDGGSVNDNKGGMQNMFKNTPLYTEDLTSWDVKALDPDNNINFNTGVGSIADGEPWPNFGEETEQGEIQYLGSGKPDTNLTETWTKTIDGIVKETNIAYTPSTAGDQVNGKEGADTIDGGDGDDTIRGENKNDLLNGGAGDDLIIGGAENDTINGGSGNDKLDGNDGKDSISGGDGNDTIRGLSKNDTINGNDGNDKIEGNDGNDDINGEEGADTIYGGSGNDTIRGENKNDILFGEEGNDLIIAGAENDTIDGGQGNDKLDGNDGDDFINGDTGNDTIRGMGNNDVLNGEDGNDNIEGGTGADLFILSRGNDTIKDFVLGVDDIFIDSDIFSEHSTKLIFEDNEVIGVDIFLKEKESNKSNKTRVFYSGEILGKIDPIFGVEPPLPSPDNGGSDGGNSGGNGGDGGGGEKPETDDNPGSDLEDAPGADNNSDNSTDEKPGSEGSIDGEPITPPVGPDPGQPEPEATALRVIEVDPSPKQSAFEDIKRGSQKPDTVIGSQGIDKLRGQEKNDLIKGKKGADYLYGEIGADSLIGGKGADVLQGGNGKDELKGGGNSDVLYGGEKADVLTGNAGKDTFILSTGNDVITDFKVGTDAIGLVYALDLNFKQKGDDLLIKGNDGVKTLLLDTDKNKFLSNFPDNLEIVPAVEINLI